MVFVFVCVRILFTGDNGISLLGITGYEIIEVRWSVRWSRYDRTGDKMVALDLEAG
jgi:hypothetical protein